MKKSILFLILLCNGCLAIAQDITPFITGITSAYATQQASIAMLNSQNTAYQLQIVSLKKSIDSLNTIISNLGKPVVVTPPVIIPPVVIPPPTSGSNTLIAAEKQFTNAWVAQGSTVTNGYVSQIPDLIGGYTLKYAGIANPTITGVPPTLIDNSWLQFDNRPLTSYQGVDLPTLLPPYELWIVYRMLPGQRYESISQGGGNGIYFGDNSNSIRIMDAGLNVPGSTMPSNYVTHLVRIVVNANKTSDYWIDGVKIGTVNFSSIAAYQITKIFHSLGVFTNSSDFDLAAMYFKQGSITDNSVYTALAAKWGVGSIPNHILPGTLNASKINGAWTPVVTDLNGKAIDVSKCKVQWYTAPGGVGDRDLSNQTLFSTSTSISTWPTTGPIKYRIMMADGWRYFSGTYFQQ